MPKDASFENALAFAADLIRIPGLPGEEGDVARRVKEEMEALGLEDVRSRLGRKRDRSGAGAG